MDNNVKPYEIISLFLHFDISFKDVANYLGSFHKTFPPFFGNMVKEDAALIITVGGESLGEVFFFFFE